MVQRLQLMYGLRIILISCGSFYIAIGADAVTLNRELGLKLNCAKKGVCKVGVPKNSIDKYIKKLDEIGYAYIVLDYDKENNSIIKKCEKEGKEQKEYAFNNNCENCGRKRYSFETEYEQALRKYVKKEFGQDFIC